MGLPHKLHQWKDSENHEWYCVAYDHGPMCYNCIDLDGKDSLGVEEIGELLSELEAAWQEIERLNRLGLGTCSCRLDHSGQRPHTEMRQCVEWEAYPNE